MKPTYYFLHDNSVQWFSAIVEMDGEKICEFINVPSKIDAAVISDVCSREVHFGNKEFYGQGYAGWSISKKEFKQISKLVELYPNYQEYLKLCQ